MRERETGDERKREREEMGEREITSSLSFCNMTEA